MLPIIGKEKPLTRGALHLVLKEVFGMAAERLCSRGSEWESRAAVQANASAHWLRHIAGSHMTDQQLDLRFVRGNFGHASISTTNAYLHTEDDARHEATQDRHPLKGEVQAGILLDRAHDHKKGFRIWICATPGGVRNPARLG